MRAMCVIPARGGSKRFPRKNIALLNEKPLIKYSIEVAIDSGIFDCIVVSTEDDEIKQVARESKVEIHDRDNVLATDEVRLPDVCMDVIDRYSSKGITFDSMCLLQVPCPLRTIDDVKESYNQFVEKDANCVLSVAEYEDSPFWALHEDKDGYLELFWGDKYLCKRQDLPEVFRHNGSIIWVKVEVFSKVKEFFRISRTIPYRMPLERSIDVDFPIDLEIAEYLLAKGVMNEKF